MFPGFLVFCSLLGLVPGSAFGFLPENPRKQQKTRKLKENQFSGCALFPFIEIPCVSWFSGFLLLIGAGSGLDLRFSARKPQKTSRKLNFSFLQFFWKKTSENSRILYCPPHLFPGAPRSFLLADISGNTVANSFSVRRCRTIFRPLLVLRRTAVLCRKELHQLGLYFRLRG